MEASAAALQGLGTQGLFLFGRGGGGGLGLRPHGKWLPVIDLRPPLHGVEVGIEVWGGCTSSPSKLSEQFVQQTDIVCTVHGVHSAGAGEIAVCNFFLQFPQLRNFPEISAFFRNFCLIFYLKPPVQKCCSLRLQEVLAAPQLFHSLPANFRSFFFLQFPTIFLQFFAIGLDLPFSQGCWPQHEPSPDLTGIRHNEWVCRVCSAFVGSVLWALDGGPLTCCHLMLCCSPAPAPGGMICTQPIP